MRVTNRRRLRVATPVTLVAALLLAACGGPSSTEPTTTSSPARAAYLCTVIPRVDRLTITRHAPGRQFVFSFPATVTVTSASAARAVASAACELPAAPKGVQACPAAFAVAYRLVFAVRGEKGTGGESIEVNPTGCPSVTGLGVVRTTAVNRDFYRVLGNAMVLRHAGYSTFAGSFRTGG